MNVRFGGNLALADRREELKRAVLRWMPALSRHHSISPLAQLIGSSCELRESECLGHWTSEMSDPMKQSP
jgi:hypothetical protein